MPSFKRSFLPFGALVALALIGAAPVKPPLDSQIVLARYERAVLALPTPAAQIFTYSVSQSGPHPLEQQHRIYRRGDLVRDELLATEGQQLHRKTVRVARYADRYSLLRLTPRNTDYAFLFQRASRAGRDYAYTYSLVPLARGSSFVPLSVTIDGQRYLPQTIRFAIAAANVSARGELRYAAFGRFWMPQTALVDATIDGKPARERIAFGAYRFPSTLPASTFRSPRPLPTPALPTF